MADGRFRGFGKYPKPRLATVQPIASTTNASSSSSSTINAINTKSDASNNASEGEAAASGVLLGSLVSMDRGAVLNNSNLKAKGATSTWKAADQRERTSRFDRVAKLLQDSVVKERRAKVKRKKQAMQMAGLRTFSDAAAAAAATAAEHQQARPHPQQGAVSIPEKQDSGPTTITFTLPSRGTSSRSTASAPRGRRRQRRGASAGRRDPAAFAQTLPATAFMRTRNAGAQDTGGLYYVDPRSADAWQASRHDIEAEEAQLVLDAGVIFGVCGHVDQASDVASVKLADLDLVAAEAE